MRSKSLAPVLGLGLTLAAAALLRFWALGHGVPFAVGVDEPEVMERAIRMMKTGDFNPHFYDYPAFYMYVQMAVATVRFLVGAMRGQWSSLAEVSTTNFYVWGRAVTATLGTLNVWLLYRAGLRWGTGTAVLAAALLAVMPLHVRESHFVLTDVPTTFFVTLTLLLSLQAYERPSLRTFVLAGAAAGLAGAMKYTGLFAGIMPIVAGVSVRGARPSKGALLSCTIGAAILAFLVATPYTFLDLPSFLNQFARLSSDYQKVASSAGNTIAITALKNMRNALDWRRPGLADALPVGPGSLLAIAGIALGLLRIAFARDGRVKWALATPFPILYFWFISRQSIHFARYLLPLVPFVSLLSASFVAQAASWLRQLRAPAIARAAIVAVIVAAAIGPPLQASIGFDVVEGKVWTTEEAYEWILHSIQPGSTIRLEGRALLLPPEYHPTYAVQLRLDNDAKNTAGHVDYLVASSEEYGPYLSEPQRYPIQCTQYEHIFAETEEVARFAPSVEHPGPELRILKVPR